MEMILLIGVQASGKSTFCQRYFSDTHIRLNLDMLKTRHREKILFDAMLLAKQPFVIDNTNPSRIERARYLQPAVRAGFKTVGYYFRSSVA